MDNPTNIETKVKNVVHVIPSVQEDIVASLEKNGIIEDDRLDVILPALTGVLQVSKPDGTESEKYKVALMDAKQEAMTHKDGKTLWSVDDWISDYVFPEAGDNDNSSTISYEDSLNPTPEQITKIADGSLKVLPKKAQKADKDAISASELQERSQRNEVSVEDVASGKTKVDINK